MRLMKLALVAAMTIVPTIAFAQTKAPERQKDAIVKREFNQQRRIGKGIKGSALTPRQGARLERRQVRTHEQMRSMRSRHNGRLTMKNRRAIAHRQKVTSRRIFGAKHMHHRIG